MPPLTVRQRFEITLPPELRARVARYSHKMNLTQSQFTEYALRFALNNMHHRLQELEEQLRHRDEHNNAEHISQTAYEQLGFEIGETLGPVP